MGEKKSRERHSQDVAFYSQAEQRLYQWNPECGWPKPGNLTRDLSKETQSALKHYSPDQLWTQLMTLRPPVHGGESLIPELPNSTPHRRVADETHARDALKLVVGQLEQDLELKTDFCAGVDGAIQNQITHELRRDLQACRTSVSLLEGRLTRARHTSDERAGYRKAVEGGRRPGRGARGIFMRSQRIKRFLLGVGLPLQQLEPDVWAGQGKWPRLAALVENSDHDWEPSPCSPFLEETEESLTEQLRQIAYRIEHNEIM